MKKELLINQILLQFANLCGLLVLSEYTISNFYTYILYFLLVALSIVSIILHILHYIKKKITICCSPIENNPFYKMWKNDLTNNPDKSKDKYYMGIDPALGKDESKLQIYQINQCPFLDGKRCIKLDEKVIDK